MARFTYNGETFDLIDDSKMLFAEAAAIEDITGHAFTEWQKDEVKGRAKFILACLWVSMKRRDPTLTWSQVQERVGLSDIEWLEEPEPEPDPTGLVGGESPSTSTD